MTISFYTAFKHQKVLESKSIKDDMPWITIGLINIYHVTIMLLYSKNTRLRIKKEYDPYIFVQITYAMNSLLCTRVLSVKLSSNLTVKKKSILWLKVAAFVP